MVLHKRSQTSALFALRSKLSLFREGGAQRRRQSAWPWAVALAAQTWRTLSGHLRSASFPLLTLLTVGHAQPWITSLWLSGCVASLFTSRSPLLRCFSLGRVEEAPRWAPAAGRIREAVRQRYSRQARRASGRLERALGRLQRWCVQNLPHLRGGGDGGGGGCAGHEYRVDV
jgi:hypothetical protein